MLEQYLASFQLVAHLHIILSIALGVLAGLFIGAVPGLTATMAIALLVPVTFTMEPAHGLALLMGVYCGGISGGLVSACLLNIPGTPSSVATCLDAFPMSQRGHAARALGLGVYSSFLGGSFSGLALIIIAPALARFALKFGPWEYFALVVFTFSCISSLSSGSAIKAFLGAGLGFSVALIGTDPADGLVRYTYGLNSLVSGFSVLPVLIGVFAIPQLLSEVDEIGKEAKVVSVDFRLREFVAAAGDILRSKVTFLRSSLIGLVIGILPGVGPGLSNIVAYAQAKNFSRTPEKFGQGVLPEAIIAPETANNASMGGALIPLLTLGIPGDVCTMLMLGTFMLHNIQPGPLLFRENGDLVYALFIAYFIAFGFMILFFHLFIRIIIRVLVVPREYLIPVLLVLCAVGTYTLNSRMFDVYCFLAFGILGYILRHIDVPVLPVILGMVLGPMAELQLRQAVVMGNGDFTLFFTRPISLVLLIASVLSLSLPYAMAAYRKRQKRNGGDMPYDISCEG